MASEFTDLWLTEQQGDHTRLGVRVKETLCRQRSEFQELVIADTYKWGRCMFLDGAMMLTEADEFIYHEMISHVPMTVHTAPQNILVIGGGDGGTVREVLKHNPTHVDLVEIDRVVVERSRDFLPFTADCLKDKRVAVHYEDGARWVAERPNTYDVILVDSTDPVGPGQVLFQEPFYKNCLSALKAGGVVAVQSESPFWQPDVWQGVQRELRKAFPHVHPYIAMIPTYPTGTWTLTYASKDVSVEVARERGKSAKRPLETRYYSSDMHGAAFCLPMYVRRLLTE